MSTALVLLATLLGGEGDPRKALWLFEGGGGFTQKSMEFWPELELLFDEVRIPFRNLNFPVCVSKFFFSPKPARPWFNVAPFYGQHNFHMDLHRQWQDYLWKRLGKEDEWRQRKGDVCKFANEGEKPRMVYVSRSDYRSVTNKNEVLPIFREYFDVEILDDFKRVDGRKPVTQAARDQMMKRLDLMSRANIVIGPHGSGLAHAIFIPEGGVFVRFVVAYFNSQFVFQNMAHTSNIHYYALNLVGKTGKDTNVEQPQGSARLPVDRARKAAKDMLDRVMIHCHICEMMTDANPEDPRETGTHLTQLQSVEASACHFHLCKEGTKKAGKWVQCASPDEDGCRCDNDEYQWRRKT